MASDPKTTWRGPVWLNQPPGLLPVIVRWPQPHMQRAIRRRWDRWWQAEKRANPHRRFVPESPFGGRWVKETANGR